MVVIIKILSISGKFEAVIFNIDYYMEVRSDLCNPVWNLTPRRTFTKIRCQSAGL